MLPWHNGMNCEECRNSRLTSLYRIMYCDITLHEVSGSVPAECNDYANVFEELTRLTRAHLREREEEARRSTNAVS